MDDFEDEPSIKKPKVDEELLFDRIDDESDRFDFDQSTPSSSSSAYNQAANREGGLEGDNNGDINMPTVLNEEEMSCFHAYVKRIEQLWTMRNTQRDNEFLKMTTLKTRLYYTNLYT